MFVQQTLENYIYLRETPRSKSFEGMGVSFGDIHFINVGGAIYYLNRYVLPLLW